MSLTALKWSMLTRATASGVLVRAARVTWVAASRSQVPALSRPVLPSIRDSWTSWSCRSERCSKVTNGSAKTATNRFVMTP